MGSEIKMVLGLGLRTGWTRVGTSFVAVVGIRYGDRIQGW